MPEDETLEIVARFSHVVEAQVAKSFLESQGITSHIMDEHIIALNWLYSNALGGVKLMVKSSDVENVKDILRSIDEEVVTPLSAGMKCPQCQSLNTDIVKSVRKSWALLLLYLTALPLPFLSREQWKCRVCAHQWSVKYNRNGLSYFVPILFVLGIYYAIVWLVRLSQ